MPLNSGGLQLEWHRRGIDLEIAFDVNEEPSVYCRTANGEESEYPLDGNENLVKSILKALK